MQFSRAAGILLHPTSFPGRYGIGDLGDQAYGFVDFLVAGGQSIWQILPLGPTSYGDSPYQCFSAFAGNPLLISPERLVRQGFLPQDAIQDVPAFSPAQIDFGPVIEYKNGLLRRSFSHFEAVGTPDQRQALDAFANNQAYWLDDFALFMALKNHHVEQDGGVWNTWPVEIVQRQPQAMADWSDKLSREIRMHKFLQFLFFDQWLALKAYANERGVEIIGDIPIFVAFDSADVWANPESYYLTAERSPEFVAGVPPDYFSETGQRWGNPLYRWDKMAANGYAWWNQRLRMSFIQADRVRIDHFRGFDAYWEVPASEPTAMVGRWAPGPGQAFFDAMVAGIGQLPVIAEDLGVITPEVVALRERYDFPGMKILQFAFGGERNSGFLPHMFGRNSVVYTGTHDNETIIGWFGNAYPEEKRHVLRYLQVADGSNIAWDMIRLAFASVSDTAVVPLQDLLELDNSARMNFPGKPSGNWGWRYQSGQLTDAIAGRLRDLTELYGRLASA